MESGMRGKGPHHHLPAEGSPNVGQQHQRDPQAQPTWMKVRECCPKPLPFEVGPAEPP